MNMAKTFIGRMGPKNLLRAVFIFYAIIGLIALTSIVLIVRYAITSSVSKRYAQQLSIEVVRYADVSLADSEDGKTDGDVNGNDDINETGKYEIERIPESIDFATLKTISEDAAAWIYQPKTGINYSVAKGNDNEYYLHHLLDGSENSAGNIFIDYRNEIPFGDMLTIMYGHNMKNGTMFGSLNSYIRENYCKEHPTFYLYTEKKRYELVVIGGMKVKPDSDVYKMIEGESERDALVEQFLAGSSYTPSREVLEGLDERGDLLKLVMLSTCSGNNSSKRFVLLTYIK